MPSQFEQRTADCQRRLRAAGADAVVCFPSPNLYYLSGFREEPGERHLLLVVPAEGDPAFVVPELYAEQVGAATWISDVRTWADGEDPTELVAAVADDHELRGGRLLLDPTMWERFGQDLRATLPDASFGLADEVMADLRVRKDDAELDLLREAGGIADRVAEEIRAMGTDAVGLTERELAREVGRLLAEYGGEGTSFETVVGSGPNGAMPHHRHGDREICAGEPVVLDFGTRVDGYPSDTTRTVVFDGDPPAAFEAAHEAVLDAQSAAVEAVEPGVEAQAVDAAAREVIESRGFGDEFIHRTGHGVGLEVHEEPYVVAGNDRELEAGMAFSVEPGVYVDGEFGVRIEDLVVVTDDGHERLNDSPREWRV